MIYEFPAPRDVYDILFWSLDLARQQWTSAAIFLETETDGPAMVTKGLKPSMYACLYPKEEIVGLRMECKNGDSLAFVRDRPAQLRVEGTRAFVESLQQEPPECAIDLIDSARALQFRASAQFDARPVNDQLRIWSGVAQEAKGSFHLSDEGVQGSLVPVVSRYVLDAYSAVIDATVDTRDGKWILWHRSTDMIYACGWPYSAVGVLLRGIIEDKN